MDNQRVDRLPRSITRIISVSVLIGEDDVPFAGAGVVLPLVGSFSLGEFRMRGPAEGRLGPDALATLQHLELEQRSHDSVNGMMGSLAGWLHCVTSEPNGVLVTRHQKGLELPWGDLADKLYRMHGWEPPNGFPVYSIDAWFAATGSQREKPYTVHSSYCSPFARARVTAQDARIPYNSFISGA